MNNYPDGMTASDWKHIDGPDYEDEIPFVCGNEECASYGLEEQILATWDRHDAEILVTCPECETEQSIERFREPD